MTVKDAPVPEATASAAAKVAAVWTGVGIGQTAWSWADLAAILAAIYSAILIGEWIWRRLARPAFEKSGFVQPRQRKPRTPDTAEGDL